MNANIRKFDALDSSAQQLLRASCEARTRTYSPYSAFGVGAALLCQDGTVVLGCNVENASYGATICAERTAYVKAVSEGHRRFTAIAIVAKRGDQFTAPCGICRQFMGEFGDVKVYLAQPQLDTVYVSSLDEMLPLQFKGSENGKFE